MAEFSRRAFPLFKPRAGAIPDGVNTVRADLAPAQKSLCVQLPSFHHPESCSIPPKAMD